MRTRQYFCVRGYKAEALEAHIKRLETDITASDWRKTHNGIETALAIGPRGTTVLIRVLESDDEVPRLLVLSMLAEMGSDASAALPQIESLASRTDLRLRCRALAALFAIDSSRRDYAFDQLVSLVDRPDDSERTLVLRELALFGTLVIPYLETLLKSNDIDRQLLPLEIVNAAVDGNLFFDLQSMDNRITQFMDFLEKMKQLHTDHQTMRLIDFVQERLKSVPLFAPPQPGRPPVGISIPVVG